MVVEKPVLDDAPAGNSHDVCGLVIDPLAAAGDAVTTVEKRAGDPQVAHDAVSGDDLLEHVDTSIREGPVEFLLRAAQGGRTLLTADRKGVVQIGGRDLLPPRMRCLQCCT